MICPMYVPKPVGAATHGPNRHPPMLLPPTAYSWKPHAHDMVLLTQNSNSSFMSRATFKAPVEPQQQCCRQTSASRSDGDMETAQVSEHGGSSSDKGVTPHLSTHSSIRPSPRHLFFDHQMPNTVSEMISPPKAPVRSGHPVSSLAMYSSGIQGDSHSHLQRTTWKHCCRSPEPLTVRGVLAHA